MSRNTPKNGLASPGVALLRDASPAFKNHVMDRVEKPLFALPNFVEAASLVSMGSGK